jgi:hypothetical protein
MVDFSIANSRHNDVVLFSVHRKMSTRHLSMQIAKRILDFSTFYTMSVFSGTRIRHRRLIVSKVGKCQQTIFLSFREFRNPMRALYKNFATRITHRKSSRRIRRCSPSLRCRRVLSRCRRYHRRLRNRPGREARR